MTEAYKQIFHNPEHGIYGVQPDGGVRTLKAFPRKPLVVPQTSDVLMPDDGEDDLAGGMGWDTLGGGQGQDTMRGGDRSVPGYTMVRPGRAPVGPRPKERARPATAEEKAEYGIAADVPAQIKPDGSIDVVSGTGAAQRPVPVAVKQAISANNATVAKLDRAIKELERNPNAMGMLNIFGDEVRQRADPNGVGTRAQVANIGSLIIHDRSGAAVTAAETPRLKPFIPMPTDTAKASIEKLKQLRANAVMETAAITSGYGPDTGYRTLTAEGAAAPSTPDRIIRYDANGKRLP